MPRPHLRHRRIVLGELVAFLCDLARRLPAPIGAIGVRCRLAVGGTALPAVVRDDLVGAADEQPHGGVGAAVVRRHVQRCFPARRTRRIGDQRPPPTTPRRAGKAHPSLFWVFRSARASTSFWMISASPFIAAHINAVTPRLRTAGLRRGEPRKGYPRTVHTTPNPIQGGMAGVRGGGSRMGFV